MSNANHTATCYKKSFTIAGKNITLYLASQKNSPLVVFNTHSGDGEEIMQELRRITDTDISLLIVSNLNWNHDMTPWEYPSLDAGAPTGGADKYLHILISQIIPAAKKSITGEPAFTCIAGYSLAGLFALYALYKCDVFDRAASMSGSLWFPDFAEFVTKQKMIRNPDRIYISLGDKEAKTRHPLMKTVQDKTEFIAEHFRKSGIDVTFEMNPGNHFRDVNLRCAKGIIALCV
jgi:predicted alpha/beta superfamily hydrolase